MMRAWNMGGETGMRIMGNLPCLGWSEWACLPELGGLVVLAKVDTGARSCALHVDSQNCFQRDGREWVRFALHLGHGRQLDYCLPVADRRVVTNSGGHGRERIFVRSVLRLGDWERDVELNLADRHGLKHPMLIGRSAVTGAWVVDPGRRFVLGRELPSP